MITQTSLFVANVANESILESNFFDFIVAVWGLLLSAGCSIVLPLLIEERRSVKRWQFLFLNLVVALIMWDFYHSINMDTLLSVIRKPFLGMVTAFAIAVAATSQLKCPIREINLTVKIAIHIILALISFYFSLPVVAMFSITRGEIIQQFFLLLCFYLICLAGSVVLSRAKVESWFDSKTA